MNDNADPTEASEPMPQDTQARLESLEVKAAYQEDAMDQLSAELYRQQLLVERLRQEVQTLRAQLEVNPDSGQGGTPRDELPPHY